MRVLSLGAGVQSSALALMGEKGEVPKPDCAIFADTQAEPKAVYDWLEWLQTQLSYPVHIVSHGDLYQEMMDVAEGTSKYKFLNVPVFTITGERYKKGLLKRQCTTHYKVLPVNQKIRQLLGVKPRHKVPKDVKVQLQMGISYDEMVRMKRSRFPYVTNEFPLIEKQLRRHDCIEWMEKHNYPTPPRSACIFCPYHTNTEWRRVKENKEEWDKVVKLDHAIRNATKRTKDEVFLHSDRIPIDQVDLSTWDELGQPDLFFYNKDDFGQLNNCDGMCGV